MRRDTLAELPDLGSTDVLAQLPNQRRRREKVRRQRLIDTPPY
jgi:hypothetical protein